MGPELLFRQRLQATVLFYGNLGGFFGPSGLQLSLRNVLNLDDEKRCSKLPHYKGSFSMLAIPIIRAHGAENAHTTSAS